MAFTQKIIMHSREEGKADMISVVNNSSQGFWARFNNAVEQRVGDVLQQAGDDGLHPTPELLHDIAAVMRAVREEFHAVGVLGIDTLQPVVEHDPEDGTILIGWDVCQAAVPTSA